MSTISLRRKSSHQVGFKKRRRRSKAFKLVTESLPVIPLLLLTLRRKREKTLTKAIEEVTTTVRLVASKER